jgi:hypothetical protein
MQTIEHFSPMCVEKTIKYAFPHKIVLKGISNWTWGKILENEMGNDKTVSNSLACYNLEHLIYSM